jgi:hypothetical protein
MTIIISHSLQPTLFSTPPELEWHQSDKHGGAFLLLTLHYPMAKSGLLLLLLGSCHLIFQVGLFQVVQLQRILHGEADDKAHLRRIIISAS